MIVLLPLCPNPPNGRVLRSDPDPLQTLSVSCMQSKHAHAHSALAVILSHAATQKHPCLAPQNGHLRGRGCYIRHTERPSGHRPRSLMRTATWVRRAPALELAPTIFFLDTTRLATISRGDVVDGATTRRYLCRSLAQVACGDGYGVTTGRDKPLNPAALATTP